MRSGITLALVGLIMCSATAPAAIADEVPGARDAWRMMFGTRGSVADVSTAIPLSKADRDILESIGPTQKYYGSIAFSPDEGLLSDATVAAANHHSVEVARGLALAECNRKRKADVATCVIAADILPRRYQQGRALQLSLDATMKFDSDFRNVAEQRAFAISPQTGLWGFGGDDVEALRTCSAEDCKVVVRD